MQGQLVQALHAQHVKIRERWTELLHAEPVNSPLGNPDVLVHLIDWTLEEIIGALTALPSRRHATQSIHDSIASCQCGRNPLLTYFTSGEQAMREALVLAQVATPHLDAIERDTALGELDLVIRDIARREIEAFCGVCQFREHAQVVPFESGHVAVTAHRA